MPKLEEIFTKVCHRVALLQQTRSFEMSPRLFCFEQMEALTDFWDKLYSGEIISENRKHRLKEPFLTMKMLKLARPQILEQSSGTRH